MKSFDFKNAQPVAADGHRGSDMKMRMFPEFTDSFGRNFMISLAMQPEGRFSPMHCHNFDQVRFVLSGSSSYGDWAMNSDECGYFPESVNYGPQVQNEAALVLTLQFPGDSGAFYPTPTQLASAIATLKAKDSSFGKGGVSSDPSGARRDAFELAWETITGESIEYAKPRYTTPIIMKSANFEWRGENGRHVRSFGTFGDSRLSISMVRLSAEDAIGSAVLQTTEFWFLTKGAIQADEKTFGVHSGFLFEPADALLNVQSSDAEFFVIRFPNLQHRIAGHD